MRIILNSDIIHTNKPSAAGLPAHLATFCREAAGTGAVLVVPRTTLLEDQRHRERVAQEGITAIEMAVKLLRSHGVELPPIEPTDLISRTDVIDALRTTGIQVELDEPTLEDYRSAEQRACLHLSPHPPNVKTDEMRDLVIWEVALRIARRDGKAMLLSRDEVHRHERGRLEAESVGLLRAETLDDALDLLGKESPAGVLSRDILRSIWNEMRAHGLPLTGDVTLAKVTGVEFAADELGHASGNLIFSVRTGTGLLYARVQVMQVAARTIQAKLSDITIDNEPWQPQQIEFTAEGELPRVAGPESDRLKDLRHLLGGEA